MATRLSSKRLGKAASFKPLNLIPIMNLFIVIIPMLLMITVTVHLTLMSLNLMATGEGVSAEGEGAGAAAEEGLKIALVIYPDGFEVHEGNRDPVTLPAEEQEDGDLRFDYRQLDQTLKGVKERNPDTFVISVTPYDEVLYDTLLRAIDVCKVTGFTEVKYQRVRVGAI